MVAIGRGPRRTRAPQAPSCGRGPAVVRPSRQPRLVRLVRFPARRRRAGTVPRVRKGRVMNSGSHQRAGDRALGPGEAGQMNSLVRTGSPDPARSPGPGSGPGSGDPTETGGPRTMAVEVADLVKRYPKAPKDSLAGVTLPGAPRRGVRLPRAERRRQDHHHRDPHHPDPPDRRAGPGRRGRRGRRPGRGPPGPRGGPPAEQPRPVALGPPEPALPRQLPRRAQGTADTAGRRPARAVRVGRPSRWAGPTTSRAARSSG